MRLYTHPKLTISIEEVNEVKYFKEVWSGIINTVVFRDLIRKSINLYKQEIPNLGNDNKEVLILADTRKLELMRREDIEWLNEEISLIYNDLGITHQAFIPPYANRMEDIVNLYISNNNSGAFLNILFDNEEEGLQWFLQCINKEILE